MEMMRAMVLSECKKIEEKPLKLTNIQRHSISNSDEVLIKIEACGVCHSQLHGIEGDWQEIGIPPTLPTVPGHEVVGKIVEVGDHVTRFKVGDRVGITPLLKSCMDCTYCNDGKEYLCETNEITVRRYVEGIQSTLMHLKILLPEFQIVCQQNMQRHYFVQELLHTKQ